MHGSRTKNTSGSISGLCSVCVSLMLLASCGLGGPADYPVSGKVVFADGSPLTTGGQVIFESADESDAKHRAMGTITSDGSFQIKMSNADGVLPGKYRCKLRGTADASHSNTLNRMPAVAKIHPRFEQYSTSGLEFVVMPEENYFEIKVEPPR